MVASLGLPKSILPRVKEVGAGVVDGGGASTFGASG